MMLSRQWWVLGGNQAGSNDIHGLVPCRGTEQYFESRWARTRVRGLPSRSEA